MISPWQQRALGLGKDKLALALAVALAAGALLTWLTLAHSEKEKGAELLQQVKLVAQAVSSDRVASLKGVSEDTDTPNYVRLHNQLGAVCSANPFCRSLSLLGRQADQGYFYFLEATQHSPTQAWLPARNIPCTPPPSSMPLSRGKRGLIGPGTTGSDLISRCTHRSFPQPPTRCWR